MTNKKQYECKQILNIQVNDMQEMISKGIPANHPLIFTELSTQYLKNRSEYENNNFNNVKDFIISTNNYDALLGNQIILQSKSIAITPDFYNMTDYLLSSDNNFLKVISNNINKLEEEPKEYVNLLVCRCLHHNMVYCYSKYRSFKDTLFADSDLQDIERALNFSRVLAQIIGFENISDDYNDVIQLSVEYHESQTKLLRSKKDEKSSVGWNVKRKAYNDNKYSVYPKLRVKLDIISDKISAIENKQVSHKDLVNDRPISNKLILDYLTCVIWEYILVSYYNDSYKYNRSWIGEIFPGKYDTTNIDICVNKFETVLKFCRV